jgi:hypothetical protein
VQSTKQAKWGTLILDGEPHRHILERDGKPLSSQKQRSQQKKLDEAGPENKPRDTGRHTGCGPSTLRLAGLVVLFHRLVPCGAVRTELTH